MCVYMHSHFIKNHSIRILKDGALISEVVLSQLGRREIIIDIWVEHINKISFV
jgi:hypothetical protein